MGFSLLRRGANSERAINVPRDAVARRAGLSGATLHRHFPDRRSLIEATLLLDLAEHEGANARALSAASGWDGLLGYLQ